MSTKANLSGRVFGRLTVVAETDERRSGSIVWACRCECGVERNVAARSLVGGGSTSCGCYQREFAAENARRTAGIRSRHGHGGTNRRSPTYQSWYAMLQRCSNPKNVGFRYYGARGVAVCDRWASFQNFLADMGPRPDGKTIDRINPFGNYEPANCRWATPKEQANNTRARAAC